MKAQTLLSLSSLLILLLSNCEFVLSDPFYILGTGKGVVTAIKIGSSYFLKEENWRGINDTSQQWQIRRDVNFANGYFYHYQNNLSLVWNIKTANTGVAVNLATKLNTLTETKNQRWLNSTSNQVTSVLNENLAITVNSTGYLVLAQKSVTTQKLYFFEQRDIFNITIFNYRKNEKFYASFSSSLVGNYTFDPILEDSTTILTIPRGANLTVKGATGIVVTNYNFVSYSTGVAIYALPPPVPSDVPIEVEGNFYATYDTFNNPSPYFSSASLIFHKVFSYPYGPEDYNLEISGSGIDLYGYFDVIGEVNSEYFYIGKQYEDGYSHYCDGKIYYNNNNILIINGTWDFSTEWDEWGQEPPVLLAEGYFVYQEVSSK